MEPFTIKSGDTAPRFLVALTRFDGQPANLTGITSLVFRMRSEAGGVALVDAPGVVVDPMGGIVAYDWVAGDTDIPDDYEGTFEVIFADGSDQTFPGEGYLPITVEPSLDIVTVPVTLPPVEDYCWPVDTGCCSEFDDYSPAIQTRSKGLAGAALRMLTGRSIGGCDVKVRPCKRGCIGADAGYFSAGWFVPLNWAGTWTNSCGCTTDCSCGPLEQMLLPPPIGRVTQVKVDGVVVAPTAYRVDSQRWLVRLDGGTWPVCQDMAKADTEAGTFSVTYLNAQPVDGLGAYAAGVLACEFAKACSGARCRLPSGVTDITRQGISMTLPTGAFPDGLTGIREVDAYVQSVNPSKLRMPSRVWSPDLSSVRVTP